MKAVNDEQDYYYFEVVCHRFETYDKDMTAMQLLL